MALDPFPGHFVPGLRFVQPLPQFDILDRFLVRGLPAVALPVVYPLGDAVFDILGIAPGLP